MQKNIKITTNYKIEITNNKHETDKKKKKKKERHAHNENKNITKRAGKRANKRHPYQSTKWMLINIY